MKEQKKKRIIVFLLLLSCLISGFMFFSIPDGQFHRLETLAEADSLIQNELAAFNITRQQVDIVTQQVDSNFRRKIYWIDVAPAFSKTQLHAELNRAFFEYAVETPATITFPEKDVIIHLLYRDTIVRTLKLQTDDDLVLNRRQASLLVAFNALPEQRLINELISLGEPIPIVLKIENPMQANEFNKRLSNHYNRVLFWLQNDRDEDLIETDPGLAFEKLDQLQDILPSAMMLQVSSTPVTSKTGLTFINANNALFLDQAMGKDAFFKALDRLKTNQPHPVFIIKGSSATLNWLSQKLPELKKTGLRLVPPSPNNL